MNLQSAISLWIDNSFYGLLKFPHTCLLDKKVEKKYFSKNLSNVDFSADCQFFISLNKIWN